MPAVRVKAMAYEVELPTAKGEDGTMRSTWPKEIVGPDLVLPSFVAFLSTMRLNKDKTIGDHHRSMDRFFSLIEHQHPTGEWCSVDSEEIANDPKLLVGFLTSKVYGPLFKLPVLDMKYGWSGKLVEGLLAFCRFQMHEVDGKIVEEGLGVWQHFKSAILRLATILEGSLLKQNRAVKDKKLVAKHQEDLANIKMLPTVEDFREAVEKGYQDLAIISKEFGKQAQPLPRNVQGLANSCIVGAIWLDMFGGRKSEWESMPLSEVDNMLQEGRDFLICPEHKTSKTYGSLAKWLTPGARKAIEVYRSLPRRPEVKYFLMPASQDLNCCSC